MKNTMKKLLCMALAIMLLVSAVPVFAMADGDTTQTAELHVPVTVYVNDSAVTSKPLTVGTSKVTLNADLGMSMLDNKENRSFVCWKNNGGETVTNGTLVVDSWLEGELAKGYGLKLYIKETSYVTAWVKAYVDGTKVADTSVKVEAGSTVVLNDDWAAKVGYGGKNATITSGSLGNGASFTANNEFEVKVSVNLKNNTNTGSETTKPGQGTNQDVTSKYYVSIILNNETSNFSKYINVYPVNGRISTADVDKAYDQLVTPTGYKLIGWQRQNVQECKELGSLDLNNLTHAINVLPVFSKTSTDNNTNTDGTTIRDEEFMDDIYLYIYVNNDIISPAKRILLNNYSIIGDHTINKSDVLTVVDDYYKATDSNKGIIWKGMYRETGDITALNFVTGNGRDDDIRNLDVIRSDGKTDIIKVRVTGVTAKSSSTADSSNYKTGDTIIVPVVVAGLTASALAAAYVFGKKRFAR